MRKQDMRSISTCHALHRADIRICQSSAYVTPIQTVRQAYTAHMYSHIMHDQPENIHAHSFDI